MSNYHGLSYALFTHFHLTLFILYLTVCFKSELPFPAKTISVTQHSHNTKDKWRALEQWLFLWISGSYTRMCYMFLFYFCLNRLGTGGKKCLSWFDFWSMACQSSVLWGHTLAFIIPSCQWTFTGLPSHLMHFICALELAVLHLDSGKGKSAWPN